MNYNRTHTIHCANNPESSLFFMAKVRLKIPEQITGFIRFPLGEMESELLGVYQRGVLTSENASVIAGMEC